MKAGDYCWGDRFTPYRINSINGDQVEVIGHELCQWFPVRRISGSCSPGESVALLMFGSYSLGKIVEAQCLTVELESGELRRIYNAQYLKFWDRTAKHLKKGDRVSHKLYWPGKSGIVNKVDGAIACVDFGYGNYKSSPDQLVKV